MPPTQSPRPRGGAPWLLLATCYALLQAGAWAGPRKGQAAPGAFSGGVPQIEALDADWVEYRRGLGHPSDDPAWRAPRHGIALPTANSLVGSLIADENVLAVRDITMPPYTSGPWSPVARNVSQLCRLRVVPRTQSSEPDAPSPDSDDEHAVYTNRYKWTYYGFERSAATAMADIHSVVRTPLDTPGVLLRANATPAHNAVLATQSGGDFDLVVDVFPQVREYLAAQINCTDRQWRYPSNMDSAPCTGGKPGYCARNCWNWYAPRPFANESGDFTGQVTRQGGSNTTLLEYHDNVSGAVTAIAIRSNTPPTTATTSYLSWALPWREQSGPRHILLDIAIAFGSASDAPRVRQSALGWASNMTGAMAKAKMDRQQRFEAAFDPDPTGRYSGSLPLLETADAELGRVYYGGVLSLLEVERSTGTLPHAPANTTLAYVTGAGSNASTNAFFWDPSYCATIFSMLNPSVVRASLLQWFQPSLGGKDALAGWGVDFYSGRAVGNHYAANDMALFKLAYHYVQQTGDFGFLQAHVAGRPVLDWMEGFATAYRNLSTSTRPGPRPGAAPGAGAGTGASVLADYGPSSALLECVPTYQHKVASFNAANVWMMESLAALLLATGKPADRVRAHKLLAAADEMAEAVLGLYVDDAGYWRAMYPNGTAVAVRHVIDFVYVSEFLSARLAAGQHDEMCGFAKRQLLTPSWMRALSLSDPAAAASDRTDHGPYGAYDGWVALTVAAFARAGQHTLAAGLLRNSSFVTRLGPYGQAHGVASTVLHSAHTYKPFAFTLANEITGGDFPDAVITALFGLQPAANASLALRPPPVADPGAARGATGRLRGVPWQGKLYDASMGASGVAWQPSVRPSG